MRGEKPSLWGFNMTHQNHGVAVLAYNGRGSALFGKGEYDRAIDDFEKALELSPIMLPALANEGMILTALSPAPLIESAGPNPGMGLVAQSDLEKEDYTSFTSMEQMINFHQSLGDFAQNNAIGAARIALTQATKVDARIAELDTQIGKMRSVVTSSNELVRSLNTVDAAMGLMSTGNSVVDIARGRDKGWGRYLLASSTGASTVAAISPEDTPRRMEADVSSRALDSNPIVAELRTGTYFLSELAGALGHIASNRNSASTLERSVRARQYHDLMQVANGYLAQAIVRGEDPKGLDVLGLHTTPNVRDRGPIPQHEINNNAPITQFKALSNEISSGIASSPSSPHTTFAGRPPLVVIEGIENVTDPRSVVGSGSLIRDLKKRGYDVLPVPPGFTPLFYGEMGVDRVVKIMKRSGSSFSAPIKSDSSPKIGGVTQNMEHAHVDNEVYSEVVDEG